MGWKATCIIVLLIVIFRTGLSGRARPRLSHGRIVGGTDVAPGEIKYVVGVFYSIPSGLFCGGTVYNQRTIITAAHCVSSWGSTLYVCYGFTDLSTLSASQCKVVSQITKHTGYNPFTLEHDIALLKLKEPLTLGGNVQAISIAGYFPPAGTDVIISGWGTTSESSGEVSNKLQKATVQVIDQNYCKTIYSQYALPTNQFCAAGYRKDACQGDSGGPLVWPGHGLLGITSWGIGCAQLQYPGVYTIAYEYKEWISNNAWS